MFSRLIILTLLGAAFVGGYHLGRKPDSPDIIGQAQGAYRHAAKIGRDLAGYVPQAGDDEAPAKAKDEHSKAGFPALSMIDDLDG